MADNTTLPGTGDVIRDEDRAGVKTQIVALDLNPAGAETLMAGAMPMTSAAASQLDGHSANIGTLADADTASTLTGLLKKIKALFSGGLPAALAANGGLKIEGVAGGVAVPISAASLPSHAVTNAGTFATQVDGSALTALQLIDDPIVADDAAFTVGTSKVSMIGGLAVAHGTNPDAADALDAGAVLVNRHRIPFMIGGHPNILTLKHTTITTAVTDAAIVTVGSGVKIVVTRLTVTLDNASTVFPTVLIGFGTANTPTTTGVLAAHGGVPAGGGFTIGDGSGMLGVGADNEDLRVTTTGNATGNGLQIVVSYFTIES